MKILILLLLLLSSCSEVEINEYTKVSNSASMFQSSLKDSINGLYFHEANGRSYLFKKVNQEAKLIRVYKSSPHYTTMHAFLFIIILLMVFVVGMAVTSR